MPGISRNQGIEWKSQLEIDGLCFTSSGDKGLPSSQVFSSSTGSVMLWCQSRLSGQLRTSKLLCRLATVKKKTASCCPGYTGIPSRTWFVAHVSCLKAGLIPETTNRTQMLHYNTCICTHDLSQPFVHRNALDEIGWYIIVAFKLSGTLANADMHNVHMWGRTYIYIYTHKYRVCIVNVHTVTMHVYACIHILRIAVIHMRYILICPYLAVLWQRYEWHARDATGAAQLLSTALELGSTGTASMDLSHRPSWGTCQDPSLVNCWRF